MTEQPPTPKPVWNFEKIGPNGYEEEGIAAFEIFNQQKGLDPLEVLVREAIQNSCDAALDDNVTVRVEFELRELHDDDATAFLETIGYDSLRPHIEGTAAQEGTLQDRIEQDGLTQINDRRLRVMTVSDYGAEGLWGAEGVEEEADGNFHKLVRAAMKSHEEGSATQGGSFGLGKAIYWMTSGAATVMLHSIPSKKPNAGSSRFVGRTWLPSHKTTDGDELRRWNNVGGWFGTPDENSDGAARSISIWGDEAASLAASIGISRKDGASGTSFAIVAFDDPDRDEEPDIGETCEALLKHVVKWYWPAICRKKLTVSVRGAVDGKVVVDEELTEVLESDPQVGRYVAAWNGVQDEGDNTSEYVEQTFDWQIPERKKPPAHQPATAKARLGVILTEAPDSYAAEAEFNSVALMRGGTGMVVQYYFTDQTSRRYADVGKTFYAVLLTGKARGESESDTQLEIFLRTTEPPAHDRWSHEQERVRREYHHKGGGGLTAKRALHGFYEDIDKFLRTLVEEPVADGARGPDRLMKLLSFGTSGKKPPEQPKLIVRRGQVTPGVGEWSFEGASFGLNSSSEWPASDHQWSFVVSVSIPEDGNKGSQLLPISNITVSGGDGHLSEFEPGATDVRVVAAPGAERVSFNLAVTMPELSGGGQRTTRVAAQLAAVYSAGES